MLGLGSGLALAAGLLLRLPVQTVLAAHRPLRRGPAVVPRREHDALRREVQDLRAQSGVEVRLQQQLLHGDVFFHADLLLAQVEGVEQLPGELRVV